MSVVSATYYDGLGRVTRKVADEGGLDQNVDSLFDPAGRLTRLTDALSQSTDYVYDKIGRLTRTMYADHDAANDNVDLWVLRSEPGEAARPARHQHGLRL